MQAQGSQSFLCYEYIPIDLVNYNKDIKMTEVFTFVELLWQLYNSNKHEFLFEMFMAWIRSFVPFWGLN